MKLGRSFHDSKKGSYRQCHQRCRIHADNLYASVTALEKIKAMKEVTIGEFPDSVWDAWRKASKEVMEEARSQSKTVAKVQDSFYAFAKKASDYRMLYDKRLYIERAKFFA